MLNIRIRPISLLGFCQEIPFSQNIRLTHVSGKSSPVEVVLHSIFNKLFIGIIIIVVFAFLSVFIESLVGRLYVPLEVLIMVEWVIVIYYFLLILLKHVVEVFLRDSSA